MSNPSRTTVNRRTVFAAAGAAGALGALAVAGSRSGPPAAAEAAKEAKTEATGGYQLTEHVKRYYATARV